MHYGVVIQSASATYIQLNHTCIGNYKYCECRNFRAVHIFTHFAICLRWVNIYMLNEARCSL